MKINKERPGLAHFLKKQCKIIFKTESFQQKRLTRLIGSNHQKNYIAPPQQIAKQFANYFAVVALFAVSGFKANVMMIFKV